MEVHFNDKISDTEFIFKAQAGSGGFGGGSQAQAQAQSQSINFNGGGGEILNASFRNFLIIFD